MVSEASESPRPWSGATALGEGRPRRGHGEPLGLGPSQGTCLKDSGLGVPLRKESTEGWPLGGLLVPEDRAPWAPPWAPPWPCSLDLDQ